MIISNRRNEEERNRKKGRSGQECKVKTKRKSNTEKQGLNVRERKERREESKRGRIGKKKKDMRSVVKKMAS